MRLQAADAQCPSCLQLYILEMEYRCAACDDAICGLCVVQIEVQWYCPGCQETRNASTSDVES